MMEEFDKLAQPSAKLHVFLFTQSEIASILAPSELTLIDLCDGGQEYFEAVKATFSASHAAAIYSCQILSPKATHNSDESIHGSSSSPTKGNLDPLSEEDQLGGSFAHPLSHPNHKAFHLPLSQRQPLQPWNLPPPSIERYVLHPFPPLNHMDFNLGSIAEKIDHSKLRHPLSALGLSEDLGICLQSLQPWHLPTPSIQSYGLHHVELYSSHTFVEEGVLHPPVNYLFKESRPDPFIDFGEYYLHELSQRVGELLQDMLECWESYSTFAEFRQDEGVPFVVIFGLGMEHENEDSRRIQQDIYIKIMSYVSVDNHLHMTLFERDVLTYLSNILQNYIFDPGGD